jgi:hypothetical protein
MEFTEAELSNLIAACATAKLRDGSPTWQTELNRISGKLRILRAMRDQLDNKGN